MQYSESELNAEEEMSQPFDNSESVGVGTSLDH